MKGTTIGKRFGNSFGSKYHAKKVVNEHGRFDSKKEYERFLQLRSMEQMGVIKDLRRQVKFELLPSQKINSQVVERAVSYIADFVYVNSKGEEVVEDSKGFRTPEYIIKRKLMLFFHGIKISEV